VETGGAHSPAVPRQRRADGSAPPRGPSIWSPLCAGHTNVTGVCTQGFWDARTDQLFHTLCRISTETFPATRNRAVGSLHKPRRSRPNRCGNVYPTITWRPGALSLISHSRWSRSGFLYQSKGRVVDIGECWLADATAQGVDRVWSGMAIRCARPTLHVHGTRCGTCKRGRGSEPSLEAKAQGGT